MLSSCWALQQREEAGGRGGLAAARASRQVLASLGRQQLVDDHNWLRLVSHSCGGAKASEVEAYNSHDASSTDLGTGAASACDKGARDKRNSEQRGMRWMENTPYFRRRR